MSDETVGVVGDGPAVEAIIAALDDVGAGSERIDPDTSDGFDLVLVVGPAGADRFADMNTRRDEVWVALELGGLGGLGLADLEAGITVLASDGPCYDCLRARVHSANESAAVGETTVSRADARLAGAHAGRLAIDVLDGTDRLGTVLELPHAERSLFPIPGCSCAGRRDHDLRRDHRELELDETMARGNRAVDPRLGPVVSVGEAESFPAPYYLASVGSTTGFSDVQASQQAAGVAADWNPAFMKAVGEALERYSAGVYRSAAFETAAANDLENPVPPDRFVRPDDGYAEPGPDEPIEWIPGEDLRRGEPVQLPAERVQFPPTEERLGPSITTGLGLGTSGAEALVSGLTEVIERDAAMLAWYSTFEPLELSVDDPGFEVLARRARAEELSVTPVLVTQDVDVPVVTVAVHRDGDWPQFAVGSGAALDPVAAARSALEEALQNWMELRGMGPDQAAEEEPSVARYADFPPAARAFIDGGAPVPATSVGPEAVPSGPDLLDGLLERVAAAGIEVYAARLTPRDVAAMGFEAVRVLAPEAQPLFTADRFFGERARTVPRELGFRPRLDRPPHPYP